MTDNPNILETFFTLGDLIREKQDVVRKLVDDTCDITSKVFDTAFARESFQRSGPRNYRIAQALDTVITIFGQKFVHGRLGKFPEHKESDEFSAIFELRDMLSKIIDIEVEMRECLEEVFDATKTINMEDPERKTLMTICNGAAHALGKVNADRAYYYAPYVPLFVSGPIPENVEFKTRYSKDDESN